MLLLLLKYKDLDKILVEYVRFGGVSKSDETEDRSLNVNVVFLDMGFYGDQLYKDDAPDDGHAFLRDSHNAHFLKKKKVVVWVVVSSDYGVVDSHQKQKFVPFLERVEAPFQCNLGKNYKVKKRVVFDVNVVGVGYEGDEDYGEREGVNWLGFFVDEKVDVDGVGGRKFVVVNAVHEGDKGNFLLLNHPLQHDRHQMEFLQFLELFL
jgi:hypothetical protein